MSSQIQAFIVDSFTREPFKGNPAGVCLSEAALEASRMQAIASELGLSETAFVFDQDEQGRYSIRYFSPKIEIPLCGHATLAAAKVLFETTSLRNIRFATVGQLELPIGLTNHSIEMEFPVYDLRPASAPDSLLTALGILSVEYCGYNQETNILMLEILSASELAGLRPDFPGLLKSHDAINGVLVTARAKGAFDFHSRYFWPWSGTNEDPVTGGTHTFLAKYWGDKLGKSIMQSWQSSERTGHLEVELTANGKLLIRGNGVIVFEGVLKI